MSDALKYVPFSELVTVNPRIPLLGKVVPFVGMEDVSEEGRLLRIKERSTVELSPGQPSFRDDDVLFAKITPCMENGKGAYVAGLGGRAAYGSTEFHVLRARPGTSPRFVYQWTRSRHFRRAAEAMMTGSAGQRRVPSEFFGRYSVPAFALHEQQRITETLDAFDHEIRATEQVMAKLKEVRIASVRSAMQAGLECFSGAEAFELYSGVQRSAGSWSLVPLGTALLGIDAGHSPNAEDIPAGPGQWGVLKVSAVGQDGFRPEENKVVHYQGLHNPAFCVRQGDLLMTRANTSELVGRSCIVGETPPGLMLCDKTLRLRVDERFVPTKYLHIVLGLPEVRRQIEIAATGTSGSMKNISQQSIRQLMIPLGDLDDVRRVVEVDTLHEDQLSTLNREIAKLRMVKQGLMEDLLTGRVRVSDLS
jgi:type I restriction enzyme, S subunit